MSKKWSEIAAKLNHEQELKNDIKNAEAEVACTLIQWENAQCKLGALKDALESFNN